MEKSKFIQDVEAFANQMAKRLPVTREGGIIIMAIDRNEIMTSIIAKSADRKDMVERMLINEDIQNDVIKILEESESE